MLYPKRFLLAAKVLVFVASILALLAHSGCQKNSDTVTQDTSASKKVAQSQPTPAPAEANIFVDEAMLAKPHAIIGGAVENIGTRRLESLSVEIELRRRADGGAERREVAVTPADLEPGQRGKFSLKILSEEWGSSRVVKLRSGARPDEVAFKSLPGAKRPPEKVKDTVVVINPPARKKSDGSEFINTPDNPYSVP